MSERKQWHFAFRLCVSPFIHLCLGVLILDIGSDSSQLICFRLCISLIHSSIHSFTHLYISVLILDVGSDSSQLIWSTLSLCVKKAIWISNSALCVFIFAYLLLCSTMRELILNQMWYHKLKVGSIASIIYQLVI